MSNNNNYHPLRVKSYNDIGNAESLVALVQDKFSYSHTFGWVRRLGENHIESANVDFLILAKEYATRMLADACAALAYDPTDKAAKAYVRHANQTCEEPDHLRGMIDLARPMLLADRDIECSEIVYSKTDRLAKKLLWDNIPNLYVAVTDGDEMSIDGFSELTALLSADNDRNEEAEEYLRVVKDITEEARYSLRHIFY
ncbi:hypothetical protein LJB89_02925 [Tyzzerella sp. OttesenSCG-928-J15]|nr:hypothetical protein [Tyzzerella sp. OttesenSCG-928-J15]